MPFQDLMGRTIHCARCVVEEQLLLLGGHLPEEIAGLLPMIIF
jgi:hypothetical protein